MYMYLHVQCMYTCTLIHSDTRVLVSLRHTAVIGDLMQQFDVFISVKPKAKQHTIQSVIVKSIEQNMQCVFEVGQLMYASRNVHNVLPHFFVGDFSRSFLVFFVGKATNTVTHAFKYCCTVGWWKIPGGWFPVHSAWSGSIPDHS